MLCFWYDPLQPIKSIYEHVLHIRLYIILYLALNWQCKLVKAEKNYHLYSQSMADPTSITAVKETSWTKLLYIIASIFSTSGVGIWIVLHFVDWWHCQDRHLYSDQIPVLFPFLRYCIYSTFQISFLDAQSFIDFSMKCKSTFELICWHLLLLPGIP